MAIGEVTTWGPLRLGNPAVIAHGGAGGWRGVADFEEVEEAVRQAVQRVSLTEAALNILVDVVASLEDSGVLNAGVGSVLTIDGRVEMDAGLMLDDNTAGGVGAVSYPRNPIRLASWVAVKTPHVLIVGAAADRLAERIGLERHPGPSQRALTRWRVLLEKLRKGATGDLPGRYIEAYRLYYGDTVGAAVVDGAGRVAAGASTGGIALKLPGRVGDSPIPGAGFYAERGVGSCSATGIGETIILGRPCIYAVELLRAGVPVAAAAYTAVARHTSLFGPDNLGIVLIDAYGNAAAAMNTEAMPVAAIGRAGLYSAVLLRRRAEE